MLFRSRSGSRGKIVEIGFASLFGDRRGNLAGFCVLQPEIDSNLRFRFVAQIKIRTQDDIVAAEIVLQTSKRVARQRLHAGELEIGASASNVFAGKGAHLSACGQLGGQHLGQSGGDPFLVGLAGEVTQRQNSDRSSHGCNYSRRGVFGRGWSPMANLWNDPYGSGDCQDQRNQSKDAGRKTGRNTP